MSTKITLRRALMYAGKQVRSATREVLSRNNIHPEYGWFDRRPNYDKLKQDLNDTMTNMVSGILIKLMIEDAPIQAEKIWTHAAITSMSDPAGWTEVHFRL